MADSDDVIAYNFTWDKDSVTATENRSNAIENRPMMTLTYFDVVFDKWDGFRVAYQVNGSDISVSERGPKGAQDTAVMIYDTD